MHQIWLVPVVEVEVVDVLVLDVVVVPSQNQVFPTIMRLSGEQFGRVELEPEGHVLAVVVKMVPEP